MFIICLSRYVYNLSIYLSTSCMQILGKFMFSPSSELTMAFYTTLLIKQATFKGHVCLSQKLHPVSLVFCALRILAL